MTRSEARKYVLRVLETELREAVSGNREWAYEHPDDASLELSDADQRRVVVACRELADSFNKKSEPRGTTKRGTTKTRARRWVRRMEGAPT